MNWQKARADGCRADDMTAEKILADLIGEVERIVDFCDNLNDGQGNPEHAKAAAAIADLLRISLKSTTEDLALIERERMCVGLH